jgi:predicted dehydrogenase
MDHSRREFIKLAAVGAAGIAFGTSAKSYSRIIGANERLNFGIVGLHGRAYAHLDGVRFGDNAAITHVCDVDARELDKFVKATDEATGSAPAKYKDFRRILDDKQVDAITIATPEHWHAPMAIMALQAGKHVYVEKPCSHNPHEGELLVQAQKKYGKLVQMGNQQRSSAHTQEIIGRIHSGLIGRPYFGKAWYSNTRKSIGIGKIVPVPDYLDWELWQGPAPRRPYKDNIHPYNWHWFWHWGTGETLNNGTHEVDLCRWALGVDYPLRVTAAGGRYHYQDDWEFYDTLVTSFEYPDCMITWESLSCQGKKYYNRDRGAAIHGTEGTVVLDRNSYEVYAQNDKLLEEYRLPATSSSQDLLSRDDMTNTHFRNFIDGIRKGTPLNSPIAEGNKSVTILQLSNIAWKQQMTLVLDPATGHIRDNKRARAMCKREYANGWELSI